MFAYCTKASKYSEKEKEGPYRNESYSSISYYLSNVKVIDVELLRLSCLLYSHEELVVGVA